MKHGFGCVGFVMWGRTGPVGRNRSRSKSFSTEPFPLAATVLAVHVVSRPTMADTDYETNVLISADLVRYHRVEFESDDPDYRLVEVNSPELPDPDLPCATKMDTSRAQSGCSGTRTSRTSRNATC